MASAFGERLRDPQRLAAVLRTALMDTPTEEDFDRLARMTARIFRTPTAIVSIVDDRRQFVKSAVGLCEPWKSRRDIPLTHSFCVHVVGTQKPMILTDAREDPVMRDNPVIVEQGIVGYMGAPLVTHDNQIIGTLCVLDQVPRRWTADNVWVLEELAASVMTVVELRTSRHVEREAREASRQANVEVSRRDELVQMAAHELRTPLTALQLELEALMRTVTTSRSTDGWGAKIALAHRQVKRLAKLIASLLDSPGVAEQMPLIFAETDVGAVTKEVVASFQAEANALRTPLQLYMEPGAKLRAVADAARLEQVVSNLVANALKYGDGKPVDVRLEGGGGSVRVTIEDHGIGISQGDVGRIFGRYQRAVSSQHYGGVGLGLFIADRITRAHGGEIAVRSEPGKGSTFTLMIPTAPRNLLAEGLDNETGTAELT